MSAGDVVAAVAPTAAALSAYRPIRATDVTVTAGFTWANREVDGMRVWIPAT